MYSNVTVTQIMVWEEIVTNELRAEVISFHQAITYKESEKKVRN